MESIYNSRKDQFITKYGQAKFNTMFDKISNGKHIKKAEQWITQNRMFPNAQDYDIIASSSTSVFGIPIGGIGSSDRSIMGALIVLKILNDRINNVYYFEQSDRIRAKAIAIIKMYEPYQSF